MSRHRRVKPASAAGHTCRLCNLSLTGQKEEEEEGRAATLLSPVASASASPLLPSQPARPSRLLAMEIWPYYQVALPCPAKSAPPNIRSIRNLLEKTANNVQVWESGQERRSGCCHRVSLWEGGGGCSLAPGESGSRARELGRIFSLTFPPHHHHHPTVSFSYKDDDQRAMPSSPKQSFQPS